MDKTNLTIIYYTANFISEKFLSFTQKQLLKALGDLPLISISQKPMHFGRNICIGAIGRSHLNIYRQALRGAKEAKTNYIALAEDDVLYAPGSFTSHTPTPGVFAYNQNVWCLYTWVSPAVFSFKDRINLHSLICERELFIAAMEERFAKWPIEAKIKIGHWAEPGKYEGKGHLEVTERLIEKFWSPIPSIAFSHQTALSFAGLGTRKKLGHLKALEIPYWGRAENILKEYS